jgi:segregation and condensation protein B
VPDTEDSAASDPGAAGSDFPARVEALLFASGRALAVPELAEALREADLAAVRRALKSLQRAFASRRSALEVARVGDRFALQLKADFLETARPVAPTEMAPRTLRTLSLIAYHQPLLQSQLVRMAGEGAYHEVASLRSLGFVRAERKGSTLELGTTRAFAEHFGIESAKPEAIRTFLERRLGVPSSVPPTASSPGADRGLPETAAQAEPGPAPSVPPPGAAGGRSDPDRTADDAL